MNHLDGVQAVAYARLRLMDTDFNRTARQRKVIGLALDKAKNASFSELNNILVTVLPQIATDLGIDDLLPLARNVSNYQIAETTGFPFSRETARIGRMDCVIPTTLESNVEQLHQLLFGDESYQAPASVRTISQKIGEDSGLTEVGENAPEANTGGGRVPATTPETVPPETETESAEETSGAEETTEEETIEPNDESTEEETSASETEEDETVGPGSQLPVPGEENKPSPGNKNPSESSGSASENRPGTDVPDERPSSLDSQNDRNEEAVSDGPSAPPAETSAGGSGSDESEEIGPGI